MRMKSLMLIIICFLAVIPVMSQDNPKTTFTTKDRTFSFDTPQDWTVEIINPEYGPNAHLSVDNLPLDQRFEVAEGVNLQIWLPARSFQIGGLSGETFKTPKEALMQMLPANTQPATIEFATPSKDGTPQPLNVQPSTPDVYEFTVNHLPAAYGYSTQQAMGIVVSQMMIIADLGNDYWVSMYAASFKGGLPTLQKNEAIILDIVKSMRYTPPEVAESGYPDLPQMYSGLVGIWQQGSIKFYYPQDWYVTTPAVGVVIMSNKAQNAVNVQPESGQFIVQINGVAETRSALDPLRPFDSCKFKGDDLTAKEYVEKLLSTLTASRLEQLKQAGITMTQPEMTTANDKQLIYLWQYQGDIEVLSIIVDLGHGNIESLSLTAKKGEAAQFQKQLFEVVGTFEYTPRPCEPQ